MKKLIIGIVLVVIIAIAWFFVADRAVAPAPSQSPLVVGGDRDEHGCIGSAGYTWCEGKSECIRIWEENCYQEPAEQVRFLLATKYDKDAEDVTVSVRAQDASHLAGGVSFASPGLPIQGESGMFLAVARDGVWQLVYDGNGAVDCASMRGEYGFSDVLLAGFCD